MVKKTLGECIERKPLFPPPFKDRRSHKYHYSHVRGIESIVTDPTV